MKTPVQITLFWVLAISAILISSVTCTVAQKETATTDRDTTAPIEAKPVPKPAPEEKAGGDEETDDYTVDSLIRNWPDDVPLMEPYKVQGHLPRHRGFRQITLMVESSFENTYNYYADELFEKEGWEPDEESKTGLPGVFLSFKCHKDSRELAVMLKSEEDEKTLVQLGLTE